MPSPTVRRAEFPHVSRRAALFALAILALSFGVSGCGRKAASRSPRVAVTVATAERRTVPLAITASGTVEPVQGAAVSSQVGGTVMRIEIREGQNVGAGQTLIQLDPRPFRAELNRAQAVLARDRAGWDAARRDLERASTLLEQSVIAPADFDQRRAAAEAMHANMVADSAAAENARLNLQYATIRAPFAGRTGSISVHVGDLVKAAGGEVLVTVNQLRPIRVRFTLAEADLPALRRAAARTLVVTARAPGDSAAHVGRLVFVDNAVDPATGTVLLKGEFANADERLWPGEFVEARLVLRTDPNAVTVPAVAVTTGQQGPYVYVMAADSTVSPRPVVVSRTADDVAVISRGLEAGEVVVTDGQFRLAPGSRVVVRRAAASQP